MTPCRPYLIRAFYDWIVDNQMSPYVLVDARCEGVKLPNSCLVDDQVILNISPASVRNLQLDREYILFDTRFSGKAWQVVVPVHAVQAIYAQENQAGMVFDQQFEHDIKDEYKLPVAKPVDTDSQSSRSKPVLKIVKSSID